MIVEEFKPDSSLAFFTTSRDHQKNSVPHNIDTLFHCHKEIELLAVSAGTARLFVNEEIYDLKAGDLVVVEPYTPHRYTIWADRDFKHCCMCFDPDLLHDKELNGRLLSGEVSVRHVITDDPRGFEYAKRAFEAKAERRVGWEYTVVGNLSLLFGILKERHCLSVHEKGKVGFVKQAVNYLAMHYHQPITSADLAKALHFNNSYCCRLFKRTFGYTFQTYLLRYRLERSKLLLKNTDLPITEIAFQVGFNSPSYFSMVFREYIGISPTAYRRQRNGDDSPSASYQSRKKTHG